MIGRSGERGSEISELVARHDDDDDDDDIYIYMCVCVCVCVLFLNILIISFYSLCVLEIKASILPKERKVLFLSKEHNILF